jgi:plastocyanin
VSDRMEQLLRGAAAEPRRAVDVPALAERARRRRRRRWAGRSLAAVVLVAVAGLSLPQLVGPSVGFRDGAGDVVLPLPPVGEVAPEWLPDGTPVFVVHEENGQVHVVRAVGTFGVADVAVVWCAPAQRFYAEWTGSAFEPDGTWAVGPHPGGLVTYEVEVTQEGTVRVTAARPAAPRPDSSSSFGTGCWNRDSVDREVVVDHGWLERPTREAAAARDGGRILIRGLLVEEQDGQAWICSELAAEQPPSCGGEGLLLERERDPHPEWAHAMEVVVRGEWRDGRFRDVLIGAALGTVAVHEVTRDRSPLGEPGDMRIEGDVLVVPAGDLFFGQPPASLAPGRYTVRLDNHGDIVHSLALEGRPDWRLEASSGQRDQAELDLSPGSYTFFCSIPGHRQAGMVFTLEVSGGDPARSFPSTRGDDG